jgi:Arc/MetJ-type ribon-helix-helix transcriptional regulator
MISLAEVSAMVEEKLLVRLGGAVADVLDELVRRGYFSTKSEAIRAGILRLGENFGLLKPAMHYWGELDEEIRRSGKKMTHQEIVEALAKLEKET